MVILIGLLVVLGIGSVVCLRRIRREGPGQEDDQALIRETVAVTADFLEAGQAIVLLSGGNYLGTISVRLHKRKQNLAGYQITMYDTGNLLDAYASYRQSHPEQNRADFQALETFLEAYGSCYDPERNALVYTTKYSAGTSDILEGELRNRIALHPLAELESLGCIHTKYVTRT